MKVKKSREGSFFIYFAIAGALIASAIFFGAFILSSKASTPPNHANLRIPIPSIPIFPTITPKPRTQVKKEVALPISSPQSSTETATTSSQ